MVDGACELTVEWLPYPHDFYLMFGTEKERIPIMLLSTSEVICSQGLEAGVPGKLSPKYNIAPRSHSVCCVGIHPCTRSMIAAISVFPILV